MALEIYNTATRKKEKFEPIESGKVRMYVCGPTTYDQSHIGHARSYVFFDVVRRYLEYLGLSVNYTQNITDVDDKIINRANLQGVEPLALSRKFMDEYLKDMDTLNVKRVTNQPLASETIPEQIEIVKDLIEKGHAYDVSGDVFFSMDSARERFGKLCHQSFDDLMDGARVDVDERKKNPKDFALWKSAKLGEISWESPWGAGRPGWHLECSAMSMKYLGEQIDIHGGGQDLIFPHHESEILQSECHTGKEPFARYWLHHGFLTIDKEKMSKSLGNFHTIKDILASYEPMVLRFFLLNTHYRAPIDFSDAHLDETKSSLERITTVVEKLSGGNFKDDDGDTAEELVAKTLENFKKAMDDDFNTREAIASLFEITREINKRLADGISQADAECYLAFFEETGEVLGLVFTVERGAESDGLMEIIVAIRKKARDKKDWEIADFIRDELAKLGIALEDGADGTAWKFG